MLLSKIELNGLLYILLLKLVNIGFTFISLLTLLFPWINHFDWSWNDNLAIGEDIFLSSFSILILNLFKVVSLVSTLSFVLFELIFISIFLGSSTLNGFFPLLIDWIRIGFVILLVVVLSSLFSLLLLLSDIIILIVGFSLVFWAESALYTSPSFIISFKVFWGFLASIGLSWVPNTAEGISEFWEGINELLFFRNVSWVFWLFSNIELVLLLGNKLIEFSSLLFLFESSILNNFCSKIDDWPLL